MAYKTEEQANTVARSLNEKRRDLTRTWKVYHGELGWCVRSFANADVPVIIESNGGREQ